MMAIVTFVESAQGDWTAMYVNTKLADQNHSMHEHEVAQHLLGETVDEVRRFEVSDEWAEDQGWFPESLFDIPSKELHALH